MIRYFIAVVVAVGSFAFTAPAEATRIVPGSPVVDYCPGWKGVQPLHTVLGYGNGRLKLYNVSRGTVPKPGRCVRRTVRSR